MGIARIVERAAVVSAGATMAITCMSGVSAAAEPSAHAGSVSTATASTTPAANGDVSVLGVALCQNVLTSNGYRVGVVRGGICIAVAAAPDFSPEAVVVCTLALVATFVDEDTAAAACTVGNIPQ